MKLNKIEIIEEIDKPIQDINYDEHNKEEAKKSKKNLDRGITTNDIEHKKLENQDKEKDRELYKFNKIKKLLYFCIISLGILILLDVGLNYYISKNNITNFNSKEISSGVEVLKALIFSVSGYLFSKKDN